MRSHIMPATTVARIVKTLHCSANYFYFRSRNVPAGRPVITVGLPRSPGTDRFGARAVRVLFGPQVAGAIGVTQRTTGAALGRIERFDAARASTAVQAGRLAGHGRAASTGLRRPPLATAARGAARRAPRPPHAAISSRTGRLRTVCCFPYASQSQFWETKVSYVSS
jgi:hypothetical protein